MKRAFPIWAMIALAALFFPRAQGFAFADDILDVTVNTSSLGSGNSEIFFFLTGTGNNTMTVSALALGGGTAGAVDTVNTSGSGASPGNNLASGVSMSDKANFLNVFAQSFVSGSNLSFVLDLTTNVVSPNPDQFSFAIVDPAGNPIPTSDPTGFDNLMILNIDSASPTANIYSNLVTVTTAVSTPEPSSMLLLTVGLVVLAGRRMTSRY